MTAPEETQLGLRFFRKQSGHRASGHLKAFGRFYQKAVGEVAKQLTFVIMTIGSNPHA